MFQKITKYLLLICILTTTSNFAKQEQSWRCWFRDWFGCISLSDAIQIKTKNLQLRITNGAVCMLTSGAVILALIKKPTSHLPLRMILSGTITYVPINANNMTNQLPIN